MSESETQSVGVRASLALYQGGATRSRIREAQFAVSQAAYDVEEAEARIREAVLTRWQALKATRVITEIRKDEITASEAALAGVREESRMGQRSVMSVLLCLHWRGVLGCYVSTRFLLFEIFHDI